MCVYSDSKGNKYKGRLRKCSVCGEEKIVRITVKTEICRRCAAKDRKTTPKLYLLQGGKKRSAEYRTCKNCLEQRLVRRDTSHETGLCHHCRASDWGKIIGPKYGSQCGKIHGPKRYKTGIGLYRKEALEHFKEACLCCKKKSSEGKIVIHHIDENRNNNGITNLMPLCFSCHGLLHIQLKKGISHDKAFRSVSDEKKKT